MRDTDIINMLKRGKGTKLDDLGSVGPGKIPRPKLTPLYYLWSSNLPTFARCLNINNYWD